MKKLEFDPFSDRLARDVRNGLGTALALALERGDAGPLESFARRRSSSPLPPLHAAWLAQRLGRIRPVLTSLLAARRPGEEADPLEDGLALLESGLYFEAHELLERAWDRERPRGGAAARACKALVQAAVAFSHQERGATGPAAGVAAKALEGLAPANLDLAGPPLSQREEIGRIRTRLAGLAPPRDASPRPGPHLPGPGR